MLDESEKKLERVSFSLQKSRFFSFSFSVCVSVSLFNFIMPDDNSPCSSGTSSDGSQSDRDWDDWGEGEGGEENGSAAANAAHANSDDDEEETVTTSLFDNSAVLPSASAALAHDVKEHGFDLVEFRKKVKKG